VKPMLAEDAVEEKIRYPAYVQPKLDGVRALNLYGTLTGRSLKKFGNRHVTKLYSRTDFLGFDGEMILFDRNPFDEAMCRATASALGCHDGDPLMRWVLFDYATLQTAPLPYRDRLVLLEERVLEMVRDKRLEGTGIQIATMKNHIVHNHDELLAVEAMYEGAEGLIVRDPDKPYKFGRSTPREQGLLRIKRFVEEDAVVIRVSQGETNTNEATIDARGYTERSTHQAGMVPNGMVGTLHCTDVKTGAQIDVAPGCMTHAERREFWEQPQKLIGKTIKYKHFPKGVKDKPRFPTFQSIRMEVDK
jgi:DNA ligase 1